MVARDNRAAFVRQPPASRRSRDERARAVADVRGRNPPRLLGRRLGARHADRRHRGAGPHVAAARAQNERLVAEVASLRRQNLRRRSPAAAAAVRRGGAAPAPSVEAAAETCHRRRHPPLRCRRRFERPCRRNCWPNRRRCRSAVEPVKAGWEQRLGARAFLWVGAITLALAGDLPRPLLDRGGLPLARGARDPGGAVRLRPDRRRRADARRATIASRRRWPPPASRRSTARCSRPSRSTA